MTNKNYWCQQYILDITQANTFKKNIQAEYGNLGSDITIQKIAHLTELNIVPNEHCDQNGMWNKSLVEISTTTTTKNAKIP